MRNPKPGHFGNIREAAEVLLRAYRGGFFPMADSEAGPGQDLMWFNPDPRGVMPLDEAEGLHIPRRLRERARSGRFEVTSDKAFEAVMRGCAEPRPGETGTWIDERIVALYSMLHHMGDAHSIEVWLPVEGGERKLVGGLYGVHIGAAFFAESKFSRPREGGTDASKVALFYLITHLRRRGFMLLDVQLWNPHLDQFGCQEVRRRDYLVKLSEATARQVRWGPFEARE